MAAKKQSVKIKSVVHATGQEIYDAFTHAGALCEWLCDVAEADAHPGGRLYLWWNSAYYASGEYTVLLPGERIEFTWHGRNEPGLTQVSVSLKPIEDGNTQIILTHSGMGSGKVWRNTTREFSRGWKKSLENLRSVMESGIDLRFANRPMIGLSGVEEVDAAKAESLSLAVSEGILITGVVDGLGAQAAGLQKGDVLVRLGGKKINTYASLVKVMQPHQAGDTLKATFYRGEEKNKCKIKLSMRPLPSIPGSAEALADAVQANHAQINSRLQECCKNVDEETASRPLIEGEWSIKENLAHLIAVERDIQVWITSLIEGQEITNIYHSNLTTRLTAMRSAYPTAQNLLEELDRSQTETVALLRILPPELVARKGSFWRIGNSVLENHDHSIEHIDYISANLAKEKKS